MADGFYLTSQENIRLRALLTAFESGRLNKEPDPLPLIRKAPVETYLAKTTSTISAAAGTVVGTGTADIWQLGSDLVTLEETLQTDVTVYNQTGNAIASDMMILLNKDPGSGQFFVIETGSISAPGTACNVTVVSSATCVSGIFTETKKTLSGYVLINGVHYPVCFSLA